MQDFGDLLGKMAFSEFSEIPFLNKIAEECRYEIIQARYAIIEEAKKLLFNKKAYSVDEFVEHGFIGFLIECLKIRDFDLQDQAAMVLTEISMFHHQFCQTIIDDGGVPVLIKLLTSPRKFNSRFYSCIILGTLIDVQPLIFDECMNLGLHEKLISLIEAGATLYDWQFYSQLIGYCKPNEELLKLVEEYVASLEKYFLCKSDETFDCICATLKFLCVEEKEICKMVVDNGILEKLIPSFINSKIGTVLNIMLIFEKLVSYPEFNNCIIESGILKAIQKLLLRPEICSHPEIMTTIVTIIFELSKYPESTAAILEADLIYSIIDLSEWGPYKDKATLALINLLNYSTPEQTSKIIKMNSLSAISTHLEIKNGNENIIEKIFETFLNILQKFNDEITVKQICDEIEEIGITDKIKILQGHEISDINEIATKIVETYFPEKTTNVHGYSMKEENDFELI